MRIWWQSFVAPAQNAAYLERLAEYLDELAGPGTSIDVHGMTPPDRDFGRLTEFRCAALAIDNALEATEQGYDAFVLGHFQDPGLYEARSATRIPVVGLGESSLHVAAQLGRNIALISIDSVFEHWHREQADRYGLGGRVTHVSSLGALVEDFRAAFEGDDDATARCSSASSLQWSRSSPAARTSWSPPAPCPGSCCGASAASPSATPRSSTASRPSWRPPSSG